MARSRMVLRLGAGLSLLAVCQWTCVGADFPDYPERAPAECAANAQKMGLAAGAQPIDDLKEQKLYFHTELAPKGYVPVYVVLRNESERESFLFDKAKMKYGAASAPDAHSKAGEAVAVASLAAVSLAGAIIALKLISNASQVQHNILAKEIQSRTLSPGAVTRGFLYVPAPKGKEREKIRLEIPVARSGSDEALVLELTI